MLNIVPTNKCATSQLSLTICYENSHLNVKTGNNSKGKFVFVSLLKQQGPSVFDFISVSFSAVTTGYIRYKRTVSLKSYNLKIESFCFLLEAVSTQKTFR